MKDDAFKQLVEAKSSRMKFGGDAHEEPEKTGCDCDCEACRGCEHKDDDHDGDED